MCGTDSTMCACLSVLDLLLDEGSTSVGAPPVLREGANVVRGLFIAELDALDLHGISPQRALAGGHLGVDLLAAGALEKFVGWGERRSALLAHAQTDVVARLRSFYDSVLVWRRRDAVRTWVVRNTPCRREVPFGEAQRIQEWLAGEGPGRLALLAELLDAVASSSRGRDVLDFVQSQADVVAASVSEPLEVSRTEDERGQTLTLRLRGALLSDALTPVVNVVDAVVGSVSWARQPQALSMTIPKLPRAADRVSEAGLSAVDGAWSDPWLALCGTALSHLLTITDLLIRSQTTPTLELTDRFTEAELALVDAVRPGEGPPGRDGALGRCRKIPSETTKGGGEG